MTDLAAKLEEKRRAATNRFDELVVEALNEQELREAHERTAARLRLLWTNRRLLIRSMAYGLVGATLIAFLIPIRYESVTRLMPPDQASGTGASVLAALATRAGGELASMGQAALGATMKTTGDLFVGILKSDTVQDDLIHKFNLRHLYGNSHIEQCRKQLANHTDIEEDAKSGIITIKVSDHDPKRSAAMAQEYVNELNWVVTHLSTSSAHRERVFLDQRLAEVKADLESAEKQFSQFASQKGAIDIPSQGRAMLESAAALQGQLIAAESELQGFRQIYTDNNSRVKSLEARVNELRSALQRLGGANASETSPAEQLYPSLRELPILGVTYADLLRRTKVEEAVFETLTQQDELAKVEEAKEIPSVKVLDAPEVPTEKTFPPRLLIMSIGILLAAVFSALSILVKSAWAKFDSADPRKTLAIEVWLDVRRNLPWSLGNGVLTSSEGGGIAQTGDRTGREHQQDPERGEQRR